MSFCLLWRDVRTATGILSESMRVCHRLARIASIPLLMVTYLLPPFN